MTAQVIQLPSRRPEPKPRPFGCVRPRGRNLYVHFKYHGRTVEKSTGLLDTTANREKARRFLDRIAQAIEAGEFRFAEVFPGASEEEKAVFDRLEGRQRRTEPKDVTFAGYLRAWIPQTLDTDPSPTKRRDFTQVIESRLQGRFGALNFAEINGVELVRFAQELRAEELSTSRIRNILGPLRIIWEDACVEYGWQLADPFSHLRRRNHGGRLIPRRKRNPPEVFRWDEWRKVRDALDDWHRPIAELMVHTGMIATELSRITKDDVRGRKLPVHGTKTEYRERELPITRAVRRLFEELSDRSKRDHIVTRPDGRPLCPVRFRNVPWSKAHQAAEVPYRRPYALRHTFACWSLAVGVHPNRLVALMGHGSKQMVYEVYGKYAEGLEADEEAIREYLGEDFQ